MSIRRILTVLACVLSPSLGAAATFTVTKTVDTNDGVCDSDCSLREAVVAANAATGADRIVVPAGTYTLTLVGIDQAAAVGDLDLTDTVDIAGAEAPRTVVDGSGALLNDHVFEVLPGVVASLEGLTIRNGGSSLVPSGGAIQVGGLLTLRDSVIAGCSAMDGGAIALSGADSALTIDKATLRYNHASANGGAVALQCSTCAATVTNTTLSGNRAAGAGGGLYQGDATTTLANVTITGNRADDDDDGVGVGGGITRVAGSLMLRNSIVARNVDASAVAPDCAGPGIASLGHNLIGDGTGCSFAATTGDQVGTAGTPIDPRLGPLACNRSRLDTHLLLTGSPALDTGNPATPGSGGNSCAASDQRSFLRPWDGDGNSTAVCDVGAIEVCNPAFADISGNFAENHIKDMYCRGITGGCGANPLRFCPSNLSTRAQVAVFLITFAGETPSTVPFDQYFDDIADDGFAPYINRIFELGITSGCGVRSFCPESPTTRREVAVFLIRTLRETPSTAPFNQNFDDIANDGFAPFINRLFELGITGGCAPRQFCPFRTVTRAEMAVFLAQRPCQEDLSPVAQDDSATVGEDGPGAPIDVLANDVNPDGGPISVSTVTQPANGTVAIAGGGASVTYQPNAKYCNTLGGSPDTFTYTLAPGSSTATVSVTVTCLNDAPVVTTTGGATSFTEDGGPVLVDSGVTVTDSDSTSLASATVTITNLLDAGQETLAANTAGTSITANYVAPILTLTGTDTLANYQQVLRTVTYDNASNNPNATARAIAFVANDGTDSSNPALKSVSITAANDAPVLTAGGSLNYTENGPASAVDTTITVVDVDSLDLVGATAQITGNYQTGQDLLSFAPVFGITGIFNPGTGTLTLTGTTTLANYQTALRSVQYSNTSDNPSTLGRTVTWQVNDGGTVNNQSNTPTSTINVTPANDAPVVTTTGGVTAFTEDGGPVAVDAGVAVTDVDSTSLASATVTITNLLDAGQETLAANTGGTSITANYVAPTLTLTGADTLANYQQVLRTVSYNNASNGPNAAARAITFVVNDGTDSSGPAMKSVSIAGVNDAPVMTAGGTLNYTENAAASAIDTTITITDVDSANLVGATAQITGNYQAGEDVLSFAPVFGITGIFNPGTGTLTLTGTATLANYETALRSVQYSNTSDSPSTLARTVTWQVNDGGAVNNLSNTPTSTINVTAVNDAPVVTTTAGASSFTEDGAPAVVDAGVTVTDVDSTNLASATVTITNLLNAGQETLAANTAGTSITANYVAPTLTLSGTDTVANYQQVLRSVTYNNASQNPSTAVRSLQFAANDGTLPSNAAAKAVNVVAVNDAPALAGTGSVTFTEDAGPVAAAGAITVTDVDNTTLASGAVTITNVLNAGLEFLAANTTGTSITATYVAPTLTLTGVDTVANYQAVLRSVTYLNTSQAPNATNRSVSFQVSDGALPSNTVFATVGVVPVNDPPVLTTNPITYATAGNTQLHVAGATLPGVASISDAQSALTKAAPTDLDGPVVPSAVAASGTSANGGSFSITSTGSFTYVPAAGFAGTDTFTYQVTDSQAATTGTISVTVTSVVWYVRDVVDGDNPAGGDGRSNNAFETLGAAQTPSADNHIIFIFAGNTATTPLTGGIILKNGQKLHGQGIGLTVAPFGQLVAPGGQPRVNQTTAASDAVSVPATVGPRQNVEIRGLDLQATGNAVDVTSSGVHAVSVTISDNTVRGAGTEGIDLNQGSTGTFTATVQTNSIASTGNGFDARNTASTGALQIAFSTNTVVSNGTAVLIDGSLGPANNLTITAFADNTVNGNTAGNGISVGSAVFDATPGVPFNVVSGGNTAIGITGNGVGTNGLVLTNVAGDLSFTDLDVVADNGAALSANGLVGYTGSAGFQLAVGPGATLAATGGPAATLNLVTANLPLQQITSTNSGTTGVSLTNVLGPFSAPAGSSITNATGTDFAISGGNANVTYGGTITDDLGALVTVSSSTGGIKTFSGAITDGNDGDGSGVSLIGNTGATIRFSGGLLLSTGGNPAFTATGGGTIEVCDENPCNPGATGGLVNTLTVVGATALNVSNTTIGTNRLEFRSISANGGASGILINNTGVGGLTVAGVGATPGSGGTIQNTTTRGASFISASGITLRNMNFTNAATADAVPTNTGLSLGNNLAENAAIHLQNVASVILDRLNINGSAEEGINGHNVNGFTLSNSTLANLGNNSDEDGLHFYNMVGVCAITNTTIASSGDDNVNIQNNNNLPADLPQTTTTNLTITGGSSTAGVLGSGYLMGIRGTMNTTVTFSGANSSNNFSGGIVVDSFDSATTNLTVTNSTSSGNNDQLSASAGDNSTVSLTATNNTLSSPGAGDFVVVGLLGSAFDNGYVFDASISNNTITVGNNLPADGIIVFNAGGGAMNIAVTNNIMNYAGTQRAIAAQAGQDGSGATNLTITGNSIDIALDGTSNAVTAIFAQSAVTGPGNTSSLCVDVGGAAALRNTITHSLGGNMAAGDVRVRQRFDGTVRLPGYGGSATDTAAVVAYLAGRNTLANSPTATATFDSSGYGGGGACTQP